jgi:HD-GYP domain-containing protein (c-di-GMP phosphodiesterase class II)
VAEAYDAITTRKPYRKAGSHASAVKEIKDNAGSQFDPTVVEAFLEADRKGLIGDRASSREKVGEAEIVDLVGQAPSGD